MIVKDDDPIEMAARAIRGADALIFATGAGMGVDSGLPDFRGDEGFWKAYPPFAALGLSFIDLANPHWFHADPALAWGFYGHRMNLYRTTVPHAGYAILREWSARAPHGSFAVTSNVDGQFQKAGFDPDRVVEAHGSIHRLQCLAGCRGAPFDADDANVNVDETTMRAAEPFPRCRRCGGLARPNILMFGDGGWDGRVSDAQNARFQAWLATVPDRSRLVVVEMGAGQAIPTIRRFSESMVRARGATLVRINTREPTAPPGQVAIAGPARATLEAIAARA
jgi:NAD-dependent SIR2 family protein deacetylase